MIGSSGLLLAHRDGLPDFTVGSVLTAARPELAPVLGVLLAAALYLVGVRRLTTRGDAWPLRRTLSFVGLGLGTVALATTSGIAAYDGSLFAPHMGQHMLLTMVAPVFLALGAPVTLALRTLPRRPRSVLLGVLHARVVGWLTFPLIPWALFVASPFALYFTGWYDATLSSPLLHELLHVHFLAVGCLFFWPLLGIDPVPGRAPFAFRLLMVGTTLPFHAFLGVAIMSVTPEGAGLLAADHYLGLHTLAEAVSQQQIGGGLLWAAGDLVGLLFLTVLLAQWMRASEREAAREDRRLDRLDAAAARAENPAAVQVGLLDRLRRRRAEPTPTYDDDGSLVVRIRAPDAAVADSAVLAAAAAAGVDLTAPLLVRHHLTGLPDAAAVERARALLAQDGYALTVADGPPYDVRAWRTQVVTALSASQERSRMAGLAQRLGGDVAGWDALGPATGTGAGADPAATIRP